eukprot:678904-Prymnesium_polylepis.1
MLPQLAMVPMGMELPQAPPSKVRIKLTMVPARGLYSEFVGGFVAKLLKVQKVMVAVERSVKVSTLMEEVAGANREKILRGLNATVAAEAHDTIVDSVVAFTVLRLSTVDGYDLDDDQMLNELYPADLEVLVHAAFKLELRFKS